MRVAIATCNPKPEPDPDEAPLVDALSRHVITGASADRLKELSQLDRAEVVVADWQDPTMDWSCFDVCVLRSTWNYPHHIDSFRRWLDVCANQTRLLNPLDVVDANVDKRYLLKLAERGVPVVPTQIVESREQVDAAWSAALADGLGLDREPDQPAVVAKPVVGAGSLATRFFKTDEADGARAFVTEQLGTRAMMLQPFLPDVLSSGNGERALVWIDGVLQHSVRKSPRAAGEDESVSKALPVSDEERSFAQAILAPIVAEHDLLYARVDVIRDGQGKLRLMELELTEPSLFLIQYPDALARLACGIIKRAS